VAAIQVPIVSTVAVLRCQAMLDCGLAPVASEVACATAAAAESKPVCCA
jgi:hypothetical protein